MQSELATQESGFSKRLHSGSGLTNRILAFYGVQEYVSNLLPVVILGRMILISLSGCWKDRTSVCIFKIFHDQSPTIIYLGPLSSTTFLA